MNRDRLTIDYNRMIVPGLVGKGKEPTFTSDELQRDLDILERRFTYHYDGEENRICISRTHVPGCTMLATRYHFMVPWIEMKKRGVPADLRTHSNVVATLCTNCYLLYDSKHRRLKTAWVKEAGLQVHKSPSIMRGKYSQAYEILMRCVSTPLLLATTFLDSEQKENATVIKLTVGQPDPIDGNMVTNIDTTQLKMKGEITITMWRQSRYDYEAPM